ncbi:hypothetical protein GCM10007418_18320 [Halopseudomonas salina]|uniref:Uncharacterized protein n=1 Tax=Halopseudomonas salina TaxID=1323744 RepID=A0ABQ1PMB6_9GAMM|nr:hypothetical protein GCM10007418_18320 [Halopseudomonas salina]
MNLQSCLGPEFPRARRLSGSTRLAEMELDHSQDAPPGLCLFFHATLQLLRLAMDFP